MLFGMGIYKNRVLIGEIFLAYLRLVRVFFRIAVLSTHLCHRHVEGLPEPIQLHNGGDLAVSTVRDIEADFRNRDAIHSDAFHQIQFAPRGLRLLSLRWAKWHSPITFLLAWFCQWLFMWNPWALHGKLTYLQHHLLMSCIWVLNIAASLLWLRSFHYGPLEWVWRSLTYWKLQPMRRYSSSFGYGIDNPRIADGSIIRDVTRPREMHRTVWRQ